MKYLVGAGIGGLFGFSVPMYMNTQDVNNEVPRVEDSQPVEEIPAPPIDMSLILPDNTCSYLQLDSDDVKEQAKECLSINIYAIPAI